METGGLPIRKVAVVGAGTMGGGIAAHLANMGFEVALLDLDRESVAKGWDRLVSAKPPHFYTSAQSLAVKTAGLKDGYPLLGEADWVCEAIIEKLEAKQALYAEIAPLLKPGAILTTNTSGLEIGRLGASLPPALRRGFVGTHFFNPPRYLKLLELIPTSETDPQLLQQMATFLEDRVARRVVVAKDTPGFIANRFGMWAMFHAIHTTEKLQLPIEVVDAITGPFLGRPKSGSFRLNDLVGLDVMADIARNLRDRCPHDPQVKVLQHPASLQYLLEKGWVGEKVRQGYYRREGNELLAFDYLTRAYRQRIDPEIEALSELGSMDLGSRIRAGLERKDELGEFLRLYLVPVLQYANTIKEEISWSVEDFDRVMRWGFGWEAGPFELIDRVGSDVVGIPEGPFYKPGQVRAFDGAYVPARSEPQYRTIADFPVMQKGDHLCLRDLGDGVTAVALTAKMGVLSPGAVAELASTVEGLDRFVLTSEARSFSAGFDLRFVLQCIYDEDVERLDLALQALQKLGETLETKACVAAVYGHCLGAGLEVALSCARIVALAETNIGLPESRVGLVPAGRGTVLMRLNNQVNAKRLAEVAATLTLGQTASNAEQARQMGYLRSTDVTVHHPDRLLHEAKRVALEVQPVERRRWGAPAGPLAGMIDQALAELKRQGKLSDHDEFIGERLKWILAKTAFYEEALERERIAFHELCSKALTLARIKHMLETGKPLQN
jgi:3-hydroxyacyl-CoA dehydrogenase